MVAYKVRKIDGTWYTLGSGSQAKIRALDGSWYVEGNAAPPEATVRLLAGTMGPGVPFGLETSVVNDYYGNLNYPTGWTPGATSVAPGDPEFTGNLTLTVPAHVSSGDLVLAVVYSTYDVGGGYFTSEWVDEMPGTQDATHTESYIDPNDGHYSYLRWDFHSFVHDGRSTYTFSRTNDGSYDQFWVRLSYLPGASLVDQAADVNVTNAFDQESVTFPTDGLTGTATTPRLVLAQGTDSGGPVDDIGFSPSLKVESSAPTLPVSGDVTRDISFDPDDPGFTWFAYSTYTTVRYAWLVDA